MCHKCPSCPRLPGKSLGGRVAVRQSEARLGKFTPLYHRTRDGCLAGPGSAQQGFPAAEGLTCARAPLLPPRGHAELVLIRTRLLPSRISSAPTARHSSALCGSWQSGGDLRGAGQSPLPGGDQEQGGWLCRGCCRLGLSDSAETLWPRRFISWLLASLGMKIL